MKLHEALEKYEKVCRNGWKTAYFYFDHHGFLKSNDGTVLGKNNIFADDWQEYIDEPPEPEIEKCPICGKEPAPRICPINKYTYFQCHGWGCNCDIQHELMSKSGESRTEAIVAWNDLVHKIRNTSTASSNH